MEKVLQELFCLHFFGQPYHSNGTKIHLDAALSTIYLKECQNYAVIGFKRISIPNRAK